MQVLLFVRSKWSKERKIPGNVSDFVAQEQEQVANAVTDKR